MPTYTVEGTVTLTVYAEVEALSAESAVNELEARVEEFVENAEGFAVDGSDLYAYKAQQ